MNAKVATLLGARTGTEAARAVLREQAILTAMPIAGDIARRYRGRGVDDDDLLQVARLGVVKAVDRFRPEEGTFSAYAAPTVAGEIKRHFRDHEWLVRPPRALQELGQRVAETRDLLTRSYGRTPTDREVAEELDLPETAVREAGISGRGYHAMELPDPTTLRAQDAGFDDVLQREAVRRIVSELEDRDARLFQLRFVEGLSQSAIGQELGVSQMQVSRLLRRLVRRMRSRLDDRVEAG